MNTASDVILAELSRTSTAHSIRELATRCALAHAVVERALHELAAGGVVERLLVEQEDMLQALWRKRGTRSRAARGDEAPA